MDIRELIDSIAGEFGRELDHVFKEQVKTNVLIARAEAIKQSLEKDKTKRLSSFVSQINSLATEKVDAAESCDVTIDCQVLRTVNKVPSGIRLSTPDPFMFVGAVTGSKAFTYVSPEDVSFLLCEPYLKDGIFYSYINERIYIYNRLNLKNIRVRSPFGDIFSVASLNDCAGNGGCAELFDIPRDLATQIKAFVYAEMDRRMINTEKEEVEVDPTPTQDVKP